MGAQAQQRPFSYHGWALGISLDSAATLTMTQVGRPLVCVGMDTKTMFCQTDHGAGYASLYFSPMPRRLAAILSLDTARTLSLSIYSPARQFRLIQERGRTRRNRR